MKGVQVLAACMLSACGFGAGEAPSAVDLPADPTWVEGISALMAAYCNDCHGPRPPDRSLAYFRTDIYEGMGSTEGAYDLRDLLLARVEDAGRPMPPPPARPMSPEEIDALRRWVEEGAPFDDSGRAGARSTAPTCEVGSTTECACPGGYFGQQVCRADGMYAPCDCGGDGVGTSGGSTGGSTGGDSTGGDSTGGDGGSEPTAPGVDAIWSQVFIPSCAAARCHIPTGAYPDLQTESGLRDRLLQASRQETGMALVEPGSLESSYLWQKVRADFLDLRLGEGSPMPPDSPLSAEQQGLLQSWIESGAAP